MPEPTDEELGIPTTLEDPNIRADLRAAKLQARELEDTKAQLAATQRAQVFDQAGVPVDGVGELLRKSYDGPLDLESVRAAATAYGIIGVNGGAPPPGPSADEARALEELEAQRRIQGGMSGTTPFKENDKVAFANAMKNATTEAEAWEVLDRLGPAAGVRRAPPQQ